MVENNKFRLEVVNSLSFQDDLGVLEQGKGKKFVSRFIEPGVVSYSQFGDVLIKKETIDKFLNSIVGCPVIIQHKDITADNVDKERVGVVSNAWYNEQDGWYYCDGVLFDAQAIDLVKNQGWSVSCTYDFESDKKPLVYNGKKLSMEFKDGNFLHLALVPNPRYTDSNIVVNSKDTAENEDKWITIKPNGEENKGRHLLLKDGETPKEAIERTFGKDKDDDFEKSIYKERSEKDKKADEKKHEQKQKLRDYYYKHPQELTKEKAQEHWDKDKIDLFDTLEEINKQQNKSEKKEEKFEISKDYKDSVKHYSKERHEQAASFYGEKMAKAAKKANAGIGKDDDGEQYKTYSAQFEEYKALKEYHEAQAKQPKELTNKAQNGFITIDAGTEDERVIWIPENVHYVKPSERRRVLEICDNHKQGAETIYNFDHTRVKPTEAQIRHLKNTVKEIEDEYSYKGIAQIEISSSLNNGSFGVCFAPNNTSLISLSPSLYKENGQAKFDASVESGYHPKGTGDAIKSVLVHEIAHAITCNSKDEKFWGKVDTLRSEYLKKIGKDDINHPDFISNYARENRYEFVAEAFCQGHLSKKYGKYTKQVMDLMKEHFSKSHQTKLFNSKDEENKSEDMWVEGYGFGYPIDEEDYEKYRKEINKATKKAHAENALLSGIEAILDDYTPTKDDLPVLNGLRDILGE